MKVRKIDQRLLRATTVDGRAAIVYQHSFDDGPKQMHVIGFGDQHNIGIAEEMLRRPAEIVALMNRQAELYSHDYRYQIEIPKEPSH